MIDTSKARCAILNISSPFFPIPNCSLLFLIYKWHYIWHFQLSQKPKVSSKFPISFNSSHHHLVNKSYWLSLLNTSLSTQKFFQLYFQSVSWIHLLVSSSTATTLAVSHIPAPLNWGPCKKCPYILPFPKPSTSCLFAKLCLTLLWPHGLEPTRLLCPWGFQARIQSGLPLLQGSSWLRDGTWVILHWQTCYLTLSHKGSPKTNYQSKMQISWGHLLN